MSYKIVFSDLDDTIIEHRNKTFSNEMCQTLTKIFEKGMLFVPCTGRSMVNLPTNFPKPLKYIVYCNGALIKDLENDTNIYDESLPNEIIEELLDYLKTIDGCCSVFANDIIYADSFYIKKYGANDKFTYYLKTNDIRDDLAKYFLKNGISVQKIALIVDDRDNVLRILKDRFPQFLYTYFSNNVIEITTINANKGAAIKFLCNYLGIDLKDSIAFGDSDNDLEMLQNAGFAIVPESGNNNAKKVADIVGGNIYENTFHLTINKELFNE